jgi:hypothetical protein
MIIAKDLRREVKNWFGSLDQLFIYQAPLLNPRIERASPFRIRSRKSAFGLANG